MHENGRETAEFNSALRTGHELACPTFGASLVLRLRWESTTQCGKGSLVSGHGFSRAETAPKNDDVYGLRKELFGGGMKCQGTALAVPKEADKKEPGLQPLKNPR